MKTFLTLFVSAWLLAMIGGCHRQPDYRGVSYKDLPAGEDRGSGNFSGLGSGGL